MRIGPGLSLFWKFQLTGWISFLVLAFPLKWVVLGSIEQAIVVSLFRDGVGFLTTLGMREVYRRVDSESCRLPFLVLLVAGVSLIGAGLQTILFFSFHDFLDFEEEKIFKDTVVFAVFYFRVGLCLGWSGLYFAIRETLEGAERKRRLVLIESEKRGAEVRLLQAQMNPHFLFNALNTIQSEAQALNVQLGSLVQSLADYLRYSLDHTGNDFVTLGDEFDAMRCYLEVEKSRFGENFQFESNIEEALRAASIPSLILQPLVENAVKYGQHTSEGPLQIRVDVLRLSADTLQISVRNTGYWIDVGQVPSEKSSHLGVASLRRRLELLYPGQYDLNVEDRDGWVTVAVRLPVA